MTLPVPCDSAERGDRTDHGTHCGERAGLQASVVTAVSAYESMSAELLRLTGQRGTPLSKRVPLAPWAQASQPSLPARPEFLFAVKFAAGMNSLPRPWF